MVDVLAIDDEKNFLQALAEGLRLYSTTLEVITADTMKKALEMLKTVQIDVVVTDMTMPGINGHNLLKLIQQNFPGMPVIAMSARSRTSNDMILKNWKVAKFIEKPLDFVEIARSVLGLAGANYNQSSGSRAKHDNISHSYWPGNTLG